MNRIPVHTLEETPPPSKALLESIVHASPTGRPLNMQAQMADAPAVLAGYVSLRRATEEHGTMDSKTRSAVMATAGAALGVEYVEAITSMLAVRAGWTPEEVAKICSGLGTGDAKLDSLLDVVADAAAEGGRVQDQSWNRATGDGWTSEQLAETFAYLAIAFYAAYFCNFAETDLDVPSLDVVAQ
jgi:alkylhydroperoxidase/carboxymuconolactone decarboxylase family protein YurZ